MPDRRTEPGPGGAGPEELHWEYESADAGSVGDVRSFLYQRRKQGWRLYWIEGKALHFRRRVGRLAA